MLEVRAALSEGCWGAWSDGLARFVGLGGMNTSTWLQ
jgi:hypothetical protein